MCFECHAEIHSYNDKHPRGRKFRPEELSRHKEEWLRICKEHPDALVAAPWNIDVGPLQALIDELEFNRRVASSLAFNAEGCLFRDDQFKRAIQAGSIAILLDGVKSKLLDAYIAMGSANNRIIAACQHPMESEAWAVGDNAASERIRKAKTQIDTAFEELQNFLKPE